MREGSNWRYICSQIYNGSGQDIAGSLPGGGIAIAVPSGIAIMKRDGTVTPHPDPVAGQAEPTAFARSADKLYALRFRDRVMASDVIEITETAVKVLWTDTHIWSDIAVGGNSLALVRAEQDEVDEMRLSFEGEVLSSDKATLKDTYAVSVRVMGDTPYYTVRLQNQSVMGRVEQGSWKQVLMSGNAMAGPLAMADGSTFVALDGVLSTFTNDMATPLAENVDFVTGLAQLEGRPYACTATGLRDLSSTGLGDKLFDMSELFGPDECLLPKEKRNDCEIEWQHTQIDFLGANIQLAMGDTSGTMCDTPGTNGASAANPGSAGSGTMVAAVKSGAAGTAGSTSAEAQMQSTSGGASGAASGTSAPPQSSGCACGMVPRSPRGAAETYTLFVACAWYLRRRRK
jgi:hypothetical protein